MEISSNNRMYTIPSEAQLKQIGGNLPHAKWPAEQGEEARKAIAPPFFPLTKLLL
jgi:hypothetical protein